MNFLAASGYSVAVDDTSIYLSNGSSIGRANIDGTAYDPAFITLSVGTAYYVDVEGSFIYWTGYNAIGRANLDGTGIDPSFISLVNGSSRIDVEGSFIYWTGNDGIGRANLDGTNVNENFITGLGPVMGIAVIEVVPEPGTGALVVTGLLGFALSRRRTTRSRYGRQTLGSGWR